MKRVYVVGTCDTKEQELLYVKGLIEGSGVPSLLVDVGTRGTGTAADVNAAEVAASHPGGREAVLGMNDRGSAVAAMGTALARFLACKDDVAGVIGIGGGGNTALVTEGMRALPIGVPKLMVSTVASGDVKPYLGASDIIMVPSITDVAGLNSINRKVLANAAHAIAGMASQSAPLPTDQRPTIGLTQFGVTTPCVDQVRTALERDFECMVFHATGMGGDTMEKLIDSGLLRAVLDITTTEVADLLIGGVLACSDDRFGAIRRTGVPCVLSLGALDMVNFGPMDSIPSKFAGRLFYRHNPQVTLMRTTPEETERIGAWIADRVNECPGEVTVLVPQGGVSALDAPGQPFWDPAADAALFGALEAGIKRAVNRRLERVPFHINAPEFAARAVVELQRVDVHRALRCET